MSISSAKTSSTKMGPRISLIPLSPDMHTARHQVNTPHQVFLHKYSRYYSGMIRGMNPGSKLSPVLAQALASFVIRYAMLQHIFFLLKNNKTHVTED